MGFIYDKNSSKEEEKWSYGKWLPHVWSEDKKTRYFADDKEQASDVFYELTKIFRTRLEEKKEGLQKPYYVLFVSEPRFLEGELLAKYVFEKEKGCGLTTILLTESYEELPNACDFIIENTEQFQGMYHFSDSTSMRQKIIFDKVEDKHLEEFSRHLATLQVREMEKGGEIPNSLTFFEMLNVNAPKEIPVKELWTKNRIYENIKGMVGQKAGGTPCYLDVHEKYHGPHGLVAGTTGSGKSETLQTYMMSLAVNYSPDDIGFFIIDYKGGGMANLFDGLPHMVGQISNLSGNQVKRAMISIKSENRRRQRVFTENGVNNINLYTKLYKNGEATLPIPHLFIIIDEFAELKREEPDFMRELISVAQVGRSLGVHLILATQKPSGTVDDNIWSNSKFRLCLRVQDKQDSNDMLHKPDAAYITQAGRCYLQVGNDEVYELFQSGYSGAVYEEDVSTGNTDIAKLLTLNGRVDMTGNSVKMSQKKRIEYIWVEKLVSCVQEVLDQTGVSMKETLADNEELQKFSEGMYASLQRRRLEYPESKYNTARLVDFLQLYVRVSEKENSYEEKINEILRLAAEENIKLPQKKEQTQLDAVKEYLAAVAKESGYDYHMQLWMPVLGEQIYLEEFEEYRSAIYQNGAWQERGNTWSLDIVIGKMDDPENQNQMPLIVNFAEEGHVAICGNIVSGKSTMMQTMTYALIQKYTPEWVNIYALDFSSKMMAA
ncbi:MAG: FtsK/SpoIIIE domain-containing protein, partial [Lachnospiraceae bacterium]